MAQTVAEVAKELNRRNAPDRTFPALILMTDVKRLPDPSHLIPKLPKGSAIIVRHFSRKQKLEVIHKIKDLCQKHKVKLLVSNDISLMKSEKLDGIHFSEECLLNKAGYIKNLKNNSKLIITAACHSLAALKRAEKAHVDAILVSPLFPTQSHPDAKTLGVTRFLQLTRNSAVMSYGLGGINLRTARRVKSTKAIGFAGISGLI